MIVGILLRRLNQLRHCEGAIREAVRRKYDVVLLLDQRDAGGPKGDEVPVLGKIPARFRQWCDVSLWSTVGTLRADVTLVPSALGLTQRDIARLIQNACAIQTTVSDVLDLMVPTMFRAVYTWSDLWERWWREYNKSGRVIENFVPVGLPVAEHLSWIDRAEVRQTFGIPEGRRVVLYLPYPFESAPSWWGWRYGLPFGGDRRVVRAVRRFCDRNNALMVVKSRAKNPVRSYTADAADLVMDRDEPGEPTLLRLLTVSDLMIHPMSTSVTEAEAARVPSVCVATAHLASVYDKRPIEGFYGERWAPRRLISELGAEDAWPVSCRADQPERLIGLSPFRAGARIMDDLERRIR